MSRLPGILGNGAPASDPIEDLRRQLRDQQQQITDLVTARQLQVSAASAFVTRVFNGDIASQTFPGGATMLAIVNGYITAPMDCSQVLVHVVVTGGTTGGGTLYTAAMVSDYGEVLGGAGTYGPIVAQAVSGFASAASSFARILTNVSAGHDIGVGTLVGTQTANTAGTGNGHCSAIAVFIR